MGDDHQAYCRDLLMGDWTPRNINKVRVYLSELMKYCGHVSCLLLNKQDNSKYSETPPRYYANFGSL